MTETLSSLVGIFQFSSGPYLVLLALVVSTYYLLPGARSRAVWLLLASCGFYVLLSPRSIAVLAAVALLGYISGLLLEQPDGSSAGSVASSQRRTLMRTSVFLMVGTLIAFKYLGFVGTLSNQPLAAGGLASSIPILRLALPLGISFWTFQTIAYVVDVYRGTTEAVRNPVYYFASVAFFPIVTAGPITRVQALVRQLETRHRFSYENMQSGLLLIGRGFFKKLVIADRLVVFVDTVFSHPRDYYVPEGGSVLLVAAVFFAFQLYFDFSGYTDIVRGSARLFGVELPINFRAPYFARSVRVFWRRWHISLMDWFKEYVYIPIGGSRTTPLRHYANLLVVFGLSGIWHGAGLTYLAWGLLNGVYVISSVAFAGVRGRVVALLRINRDTLTHRVFQTVMTFTLITIAWVFFRANSIADALYIVPRMFVPTPWAFTDGQMLKQGLGASELFVAVAAAGTVFAGEWVSLRVDLLDALRSQPLVYRWAVYYALIMTIVLLGAYGGTYSAADFLYFKY